jgi:hypothetical protein
MTVALYITVLEVVSVLQGKEADEQALFVRDIAQYAYASLLNKNASLDPQLVVRASD